MWCWSCRVKKTHLFFRGCPQNSLERKTTLWLSLPTCAGEDDGNLTGWLRHYMKREVRDSLQWHTRMMVESAPAHGSNLASLLGIFMYRWIILSTVSVFISTIMSGYMEKQPYSEYSHPKAGKRGLHTVLKVHLWRGVQLFPSLLSTPQATWSFLFSHAPSPAPKHSCSLIKTRDNIFLSVVWLYDVVTELKGGGNCFCLTLVTPGCLCCEVLWHQAKPSQSAWGLLAWRICLVLVDRRLCMYACFFTTDARRGGCGVGGGVYISKECQNLLPMVQTVVSLCVKKGINRIILRDLSCKGWLSLKLRLYQACDTGTCSPWL